MFICNDSTKYYNKHQGETTMKKKFLLKGLGCANCAAKMENAICKLDGVQDATVNFMTSRLIIEGEEEKMPVIIQEAEKIIKKLEPDVRITKA